MTDDAGDDAERTLDCDRRTLLRGVASARGPLAVPSLETGSGSERWESVPGQPLDGTISIDHASADSGDRKLFPEEHVVGGKPVIAADHAGDSGTASIDTTLELSHIGLAYTTGGPVFGGTFIPESSGTYRVAATHYVSAESRQTRQGEGEIGAINAIRPTLCIREDRAQGDCPQRGDPAPIKHASLRAVPREEIIEFVLGTFALRWGTDLLEQIAAEIGADVLSKPVERTEFENSVDIGEFDIGTTFSAEAGTQYAIESRVDILSVVFSFPDAVDESKIVMELWKTATGADGSVAQGVDTELDRIENEFTVRR